MTDSSIDFSVTNLYDIWNLYKKGKKRNKEMDSFEFDLEENLLRLSQDLTSGNYYHGKYRQFETTKNKKRVVSVAEMKDRVVHRLVYEYLVDKIEKQFSQNAFSCRKNNGLLKAIRRAQNLARKNKSSYVLKIDIKKFFDSINHDILVQKINSFAFDKEVLMLCEIIVRSFKEKGMPIGNVTSQIYSHIYLCGLDRLLERSPNMGFVRYGDDVLIFIKDREEAVELLKLIKFELSLLSLEINFTSSYLRKARSGFIFLGCKIFPKERRLKDRDKLLNRVNKRNFRTYIDIFQKHDRSFLEKINIEILSKI